MTKAEIEVLMEYVKAEAELAVDLGREGDDDFVDYKKRDSAAEALLALASDEEE